MRVQNRQMGRFRRTLIGGAYAAICLFAAPAAADAASSDVSINSTLKTVTVRAATNTTNNVTVSADVPGNQILITDSAGAATNDAPCSVASPGTIACPLAALTKVEISLSNHNDLARIALSVPAKVGTSISGSSGNDRLLGGLGADSISGNSGNDFEQGGPGPDSFRGGSGFDIASYEDHSGGINARIGSSRQAGNGEDGPPGGADTVHGDIDALIGTPGADFLGGDRDLNSLLGMAGPDWLVGGDGNDYLNGGEGIDAMIGNRGNDDLDGGPAPDLFRGNRGNDFLFAIDGERDISLRCGPGRDRLRRDSIDPRGKSCRRHHRHR